MSFGKKLLVIKLLRLATQFNQLEIELLDELSVALLCKLLFEFHHAVKSDEKRVAVKKIEVILNELVEHAKTL